jgi:hypothetical protein
LRFYNIEAVLKFFRESPEAEGESLGTMHGKLF